MSSPPSVMRPRVRLLEAGDHAQRRRLARARRAEQREELAVRDVQVDVVDRDDVAVGLARAFDARPHANAALEDVEAALELVVRDAERHEDADHVAVDPAREEQQALLARLAGDARRLVAALLGQLERDHRAEAAHLRARAVRSPRGARAAVRRSPRRAGGLRRARRASRSPRRTRRGCRRTCRRARRRARRPSPRRGR